MRTLSRTKRKQNFNVRYAVKDALRRLKLDGRMQAYAAWGVWNKAVGDAVAQQAQPAFVRGGTLFVNCTAPAWMQQLQFMKGTIRDELNRLVGNEVIKDIRFQLGAFIPPPHVKSGGVEQEIVLDEAEQARIDQAISPLADPEMRAIARRIMVKEASAKKTAHR